jgi:putative aldouronate transport system permease protein
MIKSKGLKTADMVIAFICFVLILVCILPMFNIVSRSLSSSEALVRNEVLLWPKGLNVAAYKFVLSDSKYIWSLAWTGILTLLCIFVSLFMTILCAYPLIYPKLKGRRIINLLIIFTMLFSAGTIPNYLLLKDMHMINSPLVLIIPSSLSVFYMIIMRSFFYSLPDSLRESAEMDGAGPLRVLVSIYLPLSKPALATIALFYAVGRWNGFSDALMYMNNSFYYPIQLLLNNILKSISSIEVVTQEGFNTPGLTETIQAATVVIATVPILIVYPWLQRYFITGATLGSIKD